MDSVQRFWEDQHPLVRMNLSMGGIFLAITVLLHLVIRLGMQMSAPGSLFRLALPLQMFNTLVLLMGILALYNVGRLVLYLINRHASLQAVVIAGVGLLLLFVPMLYPPDLVKTAIADSTGRSFSGVYEEVLALCDEWQTIEDLTTLNLNELDIDAARIFRVQETIVFNFADTEPDFGLACTVQDHAPVKAGQADKYQYDHVGGAVYSFLERADP